MAELNIKVRNDQILFRPGDPFEARVFWRTEKRARAVELKFLWTATRKTREKRVETVIVDRIRIRNPELSGDHSFNYRLPEHPFSFSGRHFSLCWSFELSVEPDIADKQYPFTISPSGNTIVLSKKIREENIRAPLEFKHHNPAGRRNDSELFDESRVLAFLRGYKQQFEALNLPHPVTGCLVILFAAACGLALGLVIFKSIFWTAIAVIGFGAAGFAAFSFAALDVKTRCFQRDFRPPIETLIKDARLNSKSLQNLTRKMKENEDTMFDTLMDQYLRENSEWE